MATTFTRARIVFVIPLALAISGLYAPNAHAQNGLNGFPVPEQAAPSSHPGPSSQSTRAAPVQSSTKSPAAATSQAPSAAPTTPTTPSPVSAPVAAKQLFGAVKLPAPIKASAIGGYADGCLAGARALPVDGKAWQAMRLERNRNWGHPALVKWLETFAVDAQKHDGWNGLLVGDMSQPRGGPMLTGHASHQIGLDADIWFTPMPDRRLTEQERRDMSATSMLARNQIEVDPAVWDERRARIIKRAASSPDVERIFVHPAIKKALCNSAANFGPDRSWLSKVRAYWSHHYHFHVRIGCPKDSASCKGQPPPPTDDGCGKELDDWMKRISAPPPPPYTGPPKAPPPPMTLDRLPAECRVVLETGVSRLVNASGTAVPEPAQPPPPALTSKPAFTSAR